MTTPSATRQVHLIRRGSGAPSDRDFRIVEVPLPDLAAGDVLVRNLWMSVDPYMRRNMDEDAKDLEPWPIGGALNGPCVGEVIASRNPAFREGDVVESMSGWQEHFVSRGDAFIPYLSSDTSITVRKAPGATPKDYCGLLGIAAFTGYAALTRLVQAKRSATIVISSGAGAVGSVACQIAKILGLRVVTSAGSPEKVAWLKDIAKADVAFNYKNADLADALRRACPDGIDFVLENASPEHLAACLPLMRDSGSIYVAGFVSLYSTGGRAPTIPNIEFVLDRFLTIKGFRFMDYLDSYNQFIADMVGWRASGALVFPETIYDGLEAAPAALGALFDGSSFGKCLVRIAPDAD